MNTTIKFGRKLYDEYFDVANIEYYDAILGTPFLRKLGITLDDIFIFSCLIEEHEKHLGIVFDRLRKNHLCQGTTLSPLPIPIPLRTLVPIPEVHLPVRNSASLPHLFCNSDVGTASEVKRATWYAASRYWGVKANIASEYRAMALAAVKGVYSTGSLAAGILRLFSLDFPSAR
jgi:hypothetical protein